MMTPNRPRMAVRAVLAAVGIFAALAAITHPWSALSQSAQPVIPLLNGTPGGTVANPFNIAGSFSASISGFAFNGSYGTLTATASSSGSTALPTGTDVIFHNTSSVAVSCVLATGAATATTNKIIIEGNSWIQVTVGSNVNTACINQTGSASNVVALAGGAGIATGAGGGGSGSGGAITAAINSYAAGAFSTGAAVDGWDLSVGATTATAASAGGTGTVQAKLRLMTSQLDTIATNVASAVPAGTNAIGTVGQTGMAYETVAASQTGQALGATGAAGDYLSHCVIYPVSVSPGVLTVFDGTSTTTNNVITFAGGTTSLSNLSPISIPVGATSLNSGGWKVTTGANLLVICYGRFT